MMRTNELLATQDVRGFFKENLVDLIDQHNMDVGEDVIAYVTNMLTTFVRSERFYEWTPQGPTLAPLAMMYGEVVNTQSIVQKRQLLQRLGDVALFVAGMFTESFQRKAYDVSYYIDMGVAAYGSLSESMDGRTLEQSHSQIFAELATGFENFVQVLTEISDQSNLQDDRDVLKLYQAWMRTGSPRAAKMLEKAGINVISSGNRTQH